VAWLISFPENNKARAAMTDCDKHSSLLRSKINYNYSKTSFLVQIKFITED